MPVIALVVSLTACGEGESDRQGQTAPETTAAQSFRNLELRETADGKLEWVLRAKQASRVSASAPTALESIHIDFYQGTAEIRSVLTADSGRVDSKKGQLVAKGSVVVTTKEGNRLETEELHWDREDAKVYSDLPVRLIRQEDILTGIGFESDPNLDHFRLFKDVHASVKEAEGVGGDLFGADSSGRED